MLIDTQASMGNTVSTSSYDQVLRQLQCAPCVDGPRVAFGLKPVRESTGACPLWLFGETHDSIYSNKLCRSVTVILRQVLCCRQPESNQRTQKCITPVKVYLELWSRDPRAYESSIQIIQITQTIKFKTKTSFG